eukprot:5198926-Karenia_brevis.AAC.1
MSEYANAKPARRKAWNAAKNAKTAQHSAEHIATMKAATSSWQAAWSHPSYACAFRVSSHFLFSAISCTAGGLQN